MRRPLLVVLLALGACTPEPPAPDALLAAGYEELRRGDLEAARARAAEGRRRAADLGDPDWGRRFAVLDAEALVEQRHSAEALPLLDGALASGAGDALDARARLTRGLAHCLLATGPGEIREAEADLDEAHRLARRTEARDLLGWIQLRRGTCHLVGGDATAAESHFRGALATARKEEQPFLEVSAAGSLGFIRARGARYDDATDWFERALERASSLDADLLRVKILGNLAWCSYELGDYEGALAHLSRVESLAEERGQTGDLAIALQSAGNAHYRLGDLARAGDAYRRALALARELEDRRAAAQLVGNLGYLAIAAGRYDEAEAHVGEALRIKEEIDDEPGRQHSLLALGQAREGQGEAEEAEGRYREVIASPHADAALLWEARATLAHLLVDQERPGEAEAEFGRAFAIMEESRAQLREATHRISFSSSLGRFYDSYVDFLVEDGRGEKALEVADLSRARQLREGMGDESPGPRGTAARFRRTARDLDAVLLAYWLAPARSFLWVVTPDRVDLHVLPGEEAIADRVERHQAKIQRSRDLAAEGAEEARWLHRELVGPAEGALSRGARVLVVPDGALHRLNMETVLVSSGETRYWIEDVRLSTAPSLSLLAARSRAGGPPSRGLLVIGDAESPSPEFPRLAHAATEVRRVTEPFAPPGVTVYSGSRAEPAIYRRAEPGRYSLIHFAAHATANRERPLDSAVILSARDDAFKLYAREIVEVPLRARLVTLSACRSAGSRTYAGEGLVGLAWAFLSSGADNVIAGLWNVEDASTAELMGELYRRLGEGQDPDEALRAAKLRLLRSSTAHRKPFYWAPFVVYTQRARTTRSNAALPVPPR